MKNKTTLMLLPLYAYLILLSNLGANENVLDEIKKKKNEIKNINEETLLLKATDGQNVKRAVSHENAGLIDEARLIFEQIFNAKKSSSYIFSNYKNFLIRQEDWLKLIEISREYASSNEGNPNAMLALAESLLYVSEKNMIYEKLESEGYQIINNLILENLTDATKPIYTSRLKRYVSRLIYYNKYEFAILKINEMRNQYNYPDFYSKDLGRYYLLNREYELSLNEFILCLTNPKELKKYINNEFGSIRNQFARFPDDESIKEIIIKTLMTGTSKIKNNILAEYKFKWQNYDEASDLMIKNYFNEKSLYDFSINIMKENQLANAEKIFNFLMNSNNDEIVELSIFQLATILEIKSKKEKIYLPISDRIIENSFLQLEPFGYTKIDSSESNEQLSKAIMMYDSLITKYNNSKAKYKIAEFKSMTNADYHESINDFIELEKSATDRKVRFQSAIKIIDISIKNGLLDEKLLSLIEKYKKRYKSDNQEDYLDLKRYQVLFYLKNFEKLTTELNDKLKLLDRGNPFYNEFLDGITLIMLFNDKEDDLFLFCDGLFEIRKGNYPEAIVKFNLLSKSKTEIINNISSYYLAYVYINLHDYSLSKEPLSVTNDIFSELTLLLSAELNDYVIKDINLATDRYMDFINQFESSIFYEEIRIRLEEIIKEITG